LLLTIIEELEIFFLQIADGVTCRVTDDDGDWN
jgi:hypothetical protein